MENPIRVAIVGDYNPEFESHPATTNAIHVAAQALQLPVEVKWWPTPQVSDAALAQFDGVWASPGSPYRSMEGMLHALRFAREHLRPMAAT